MYSKQICMYLYVNQLQWLKKSQMSVEVCVEIVVVNSNNVTGTPHNTIWSSTMLQTEMNQHLSKSHKKWLQTSCRYSTIYCRAIILDSITLWVFLLFCPPTVRQQQQHQKNSDSCMSLDCSVKIPLPFKVINHDIILYWPIVRTAELQPQQRLPAALHYFWFPRLCRLSHKIVNKSFHFFSPHFFFLLSFLLFLFLFSHLDQDWEKNNKHIFELRGKGMNLAC